MEICEIIFVLTEFPATNPVVYSNETMLLSQRTRPPHLQESLSQRTYPRPRATIQIELYRNLHSQNILFLLKFDDECAIHTWLLMLALTA